MSKIGRNDPCPCGSGKKYKKCHLPEDEAQSRLVTIKSELSPSQTMADVEDGADFWESELENPDLHSEEEQVEVASVFLEMFQKSGPDEKVELFKKTVESPAVSEDDFLLGFFDDLDLAAELPADRKTFQEIIDLFKELLPERFLKVGKDLVDICLDQAFVDGPREAVASRFEELIALSSDPMDTVVSRADELAYHGLLEPLVKGYLTAWPQVDLYVETGFASKRELEKKGVDYEIFKHLDAGLSWEDPALEQRVHFYLKPDVFDLHRYFDEILRPQATWAREAFAVDLKTVKESNAVWENFLSQLASLANAFLAFLKREKGYSWSRADLVRDATMNYIVDRLTGRLKLERGKKGTPKYWEDKVVKVLCPDAFTVDGYFAELSNEYPSQAHRSAAFHQGIPHWLEFLNRVGLVDQAIQSDILSSLQPLLTETEGMFLEPTPAYLAETPFVAMSAIT